LVSTNYTSLSKDKKLVLKILEEKKLPVIVKDKGMEIKA